MQMEATKVKGQIIAKHAAKNLLHHFIRIKSDPIPPKNIEASRAEARNFLGKNWTINIFNLGEQICCDRVFRSS
jgi:hypothetical protein